MQNLKKLKELTIEEAKEVNGGAWPILGFIIAAIVAGCASNPKRPRSDDMNPHDHIP